MRKSIYALALVGAMLPLAACGADNDADDDGDTTIVETTPAPTATETTVITDGETPTDGNTVTVGPDGASVDIDAGDTQIRATTGSDDTPDAN